MTRDRIVGIIIGSVAFVFAHGFITGAWLRATLTPDPMIRPWFTNSSRSVLLTAVVVGLAAFAWALSAMDRRSALARGVTVGVGATVAMLAVMSTIGIGTLGPIVFVIGGAILIAAGAAGASVASMFKPG